MPELRLAKRLASARHRSGFPVHHARFALSQNRPKCVFIGDLWIDALWW
jgi:hypothetical protein